MPTNILIENIYIPGSSITLIMLTNIYKYYIINLSIFTLNMTIVREESFISLPPKRPCSCYPNYTPTHLLSRR